MRPAKKIIPIHISDTTKGPFGPLVVIFNTSQQNTLPMNSPHYRCKSNLLSRDFRLLGFGFS